MFQQIYLSSPEQLPEEFVKAWNKKDAIVLANLFAEDAEFINVVGLWWHDRASIWKAHHYGFTTIFPDSTLALRRVKTRLLSNQVAVVYARMALTGQSPKEGTRTLGKRFNIFTFVLQKMDAGWICVSAHNTDVIPGKETNIVRPDGSLAAIDYRS